MPIITAAIDPVTRIEGHLKIGVEIETVDGVQQVIDAHAVGTLPADATSVFYMVTTD